MTISTIQHSENTAKKGGNNDDVAVFHADNKDNQGQDNGSHEEAEGQNLDAEGVKNEEASQTGDI